MTMEAFTKTVPLILCNKITALCARALPVPSPVIQVRAPASMMVSLSPKTSNFPPLMGATGASAAERKLPAQRKTAVSWFLFLHLSHEKLFRFNKNGGGESRGLNDRVHGISCRYSDKTSKQNLSHFF